MSDFTRDMYKEHILDLYKNPPHYGRLKTPTHSFRGYNPLCGDDIHVELSIQDGKIVDAKFTGKGCAISIASSGLLMEHIIGKDATDVEKMAKENVVRLLDIQINPVRQKCATLCLDAIKKAIVGEK